MPTPCSICRLPTRTREQLRTWRRAGVPLREAAARLAEDGHRADKSAIHRHEHSCEPPMPDELDLAGEPEDPPSLAVAVLTADVLARFPSLARQLATDLHREQLHRAARIVLAAVPEQMRGALDSTEPGSHPAQLLQARAVLRAVGVALRTSPELAALVADCLISEGLHDLAAAVHDVASNLMEDTREHQH